MCGERGRGCGSGGYRVWAPRSQTDRDAAEDDVERRCEEQSEDRHSEHDGEHRGAEHLPHLGAGPHGAGQRQDAEDKGERRHHDGTHSQPAGLDRGVETVFAFLFQLLGKLDDQHGVLRRPADEHDETDLRGQDGVGIALEAVPERERQADRRDFAVFSGGNTRKAIVSLGMPGRTIYRHEGFCRFRRFFRWPSLARANPLLAASICPNFLSELGFQ